MYVCGVSSSPVLMPFAAVAVGLETISSTIQSFLLSSISLTG